MIVVPVSAHLAPAQPVCVRQAVVVLARAQLAPARLVYILELVAVLARAAGACATGACTIIGCGSGARATGACITGAYTIVGCVTDISSTGTGTTMCERSSPEPQSLYWFLAASRARQLYVAHQARQKMHHPPTSNHGTSTHVVSNTA
jgi:predicted RNA methylase